MQTKFCRLLFLVVKELNPVGIWCQNDVVLTSMRRHHVASTSIRRHFGTKCPLGNQSLRCMGIHPFFYPIFLKKGQYFLLASLGDKTLPNRDRCLKERSCSCSESVSIYFNSLTTNKTVDTILQILKQY